MKIKCWIALCEDKQPICWDDDSTMFYVWNTKPLPEDFGLEENEQIVKATIKFKLLKRKTVKKK